MEVLSVSSSSLLLQTEHLLSTHRLSSSSPSSCPSPSFLRNNQWHLPSLQEGNHPSIRLSGWRQPPFSGSRRTFEGLWGFQQGRRTAGGEERTGNSRGKTLGSCERSNEEAMPVSYGSCERSNEEAMPVSYGGDGGGGLGGRGRGDSAGYFGGNEDPGDDGMEGDEDDYKLSHQTESANEQTWVGRLSSGKGLREGVLRCASQLQNFSRHGGFGLGPRGVRVLAGGGVLLACNMGAGLVPSRVVLVKAGAKGGNHSGSWEGTKKGEAIRVNSHDRLCTNIFLGINVLMFLAQWATKGRLLVMGAKVNSLIDSGQYWRFLTPIFLHANISHLLVNSFSLDSMGPQVEGLGGRGRFLGVYLAAAVTGTYLSYRMAPQPSVGASGAISGLVGALCIFLLRHRELLGPAAHQGLKHLVKVITLNAMFGLASPGIDNWCHLGGFLGGAAAAFLMGPNYVWRKDGAWSKPYLVDEPPLRMLTGRSTSR